MDKSAFLSKHALAYVCKAYTFFEKFAKDSFEVGRMVFIDLLVFVSLLFFY
jgi:hypothetical protein